MKHVYVASMFAYFAYTWPPKILNNLFLVPFCRYEKVHPLPNWASTARDSSRGKKRRRSSQGEDNGDNDDHLSTLLSSSGALLSSNRPKLLPPHEISIGRLSDANQAANAETGLVSVQFHPSPSVPVLMTAGRDRRLRLFNVNEFACSIQHRS